MIEAHGLVKRYGSLEAVSSLDLRVRQGELYALLGPNGAGKTTTISILTTLVPPTSGRACVDGHDIVQHPNRVRRSIGVTFQDLVIDQDLTGRQVLDIHGRLYRQPAGERRRRIAELVEMVSLGDAIDRLVKTYSGGMKRRLELARGLMTEPRVLFLDEPTQGLDPQNRATIWEYVLRLKREHGMTTLLTTHAMEEAEALADTVGIIDHGRMVAQGSPATLIDNVGADTIRMAGSGPLAGALEQLRVLPFVEHAEYLAEQRALEVRVDSGARRLAEVIALVLNQGAAIDDVSMARPSLGDVFLQQTGRALRD
jgi:ABC-2 type transport system ATP-binding protein